MHCLAALDGARDMAQSIDHRFFAQCVKAAPTKLYVRKSVAIDHYLFAHCVEVPQRTVGGSNSSSITTICKCHFALIAYTAQYTSTLSWLLSRNTPMVIERILQRKLKLEYICFTANIKSLHHGALLTSRIKQPNLAAHINATTYTAGTDTAKRHGTQEPTIYIFFCSHIR